MFKHNLRALERDFAASANGFRREAPAAVERTARYGWRKAFRLAKRRSGSHGSRFPYAIDIERHNPLEFEYFTNPAKPQGNMAFEEGPGPQTTPHPNFEQSAEGLADRLQRNVSSAQRRTWRVT